MVAKRREDGAELLKKLAEKYGEKAGEDVDEAEFVETQKKMIGKSKGTKKKKISKS